MYIKLSMSILVERRGGCEVNIKYQKKKKKKRKFKSDELFLVLFFFFRTGKSKLA